jgi:hypothetical protein
MRAVCWRSAALLVGISVVAGGRARAVGAQEPQLESLPRVAGGSGATAIRTGANKGIRPEGLIHLDVAVTDGAGELVTGLEPRDFTLLDDGHPEPIVSFDAFGGMRAAAPEPPLVILLIDTLDAGAVEQEERRGVEQFLRKNQGRLAHPTMVFSLEDTGFWLDAQPSMDGNALADAVEHLKRVRLLLGPASSFEVQPGAQPIAGLGRIDNEYWLFPPASALKALGWIATAERRKAGRKLLLWIGPGVGMGSGAYPDRKYELSTVGRLVYGGSVKRYFPANLGCGDSLFSKEPRPDSHCPQAQQNVLDMAQWFSTLLREARLVVDTFAVGEENVTLSRQPGFKNPEAKSDRPGVRLIDEWKQYLTGPASAEETSPMELYKKVLAVESGGRALSGAEAGGKEEQAGVAEQIEDCVRGLGAFYTLTFDPPAAAHADEAHSITVKVDGAGVTAHTNAGYYDEPYFTDEPDPAARQVTATELEAAVDAARGISDEEAAQRLAHLALMEQVSAEKLASLSAEMRGAKARQALTAVVDAAAFLQLPTGELRAGGDAPDGAEQTRLLGLAVQYLNQTIPKLPDFFATRTAVQYSETPAFHEGNTQVRATPMHETTAYRAGVLYRTGGEVVEQAKVKHPEKDAWMLTYGTFGPLLPTMREALQVPGNATWRRWETGVDGKRAVFAYAVPAAQSQFAVLGCCLPSGDGTSGFAAIPGYHGEIAIDAVTGAILRITVEAELKGFVPQDRSEMMVEYGPVTLGGKTYVLPQRSVSLARQRVIAGLGEWNEAFLTWGPYETTVNEFSFTDYHMFRGEGRILPGPSPADSPPQ